ncbi:hypothetical protein [Methanolobus sp. WCC5]|jgi:hypothetical protein|uniref:hypothetical protein n=1 Tax=Methanolobus sp. WCC5 TaxID=3125785 RepID=UPI00324F5C89
MILKYNLFVTLILLIAATTAVQADPMQTEYEYYFGLYPYNHQLIERYGTLPVFENEEQKATWNSALEELSDTIKDDFAAQYMYPYGDVVTCGSNSDGYFVVLFRNMNVNKQLLDEMYVFIGNAGNGLDIHDIPVEFGYGDYFYLFGEDMSVLPENEIQSTSNYLKSGRDMEVTEIPTLAVYGEIPKWEDDDEFDEWNKMLLLIQENSSMEVMHTGKVEWYGGITNKGPLKGIIPIAISKGLSEREKRVLVTEIYAIIYEEARKENIANIPVIFFEDEIILVDERVELDSNDDTTIVENETVEQPANTTPGFSALTLLIVVSLLLVWRSTKIR